MFDLTKEIKLSPEMQKKYRVAQPVIYLLFLFGMVYFAFLVFFPSMNFDFSFQSARALKNTVINPRNSAGELNETGRINSQEALFFNVNPFGEFSRAKVEFDLEKDSAPIEEGTVSAKKSYQAFFYSLGNPMGLPDGTLLKNNGNYYLVSDGKLRKFSDWNLAENLGYSQTAFEEAGEEDLKYNEKGSDISALEKFPDDSFFFVAGDYYRLKNQRLSKYVSENAFLKNHRTEKALVKNPDFLNTFEIDEDFIGFPDGTLVSFDGSVFMISGGRNYPIDSVFTFESMGFSWNDVLPSSEEEIGIHKKEKLFTLNVPHPDGVVFLDRDAGKYYYVQNFTLRELKSPLVIKEYTQNTPIPVDASSLKIETACEIKTQSRIFSRYGCVLPVENIINFAGNSFQMETSFSPEIHVKTMRVTFKKNINWKSLRSTLSSIKNRILLQYER